MAIVERLYDLVATACLKAKRGTKAVAVEEDTATMEANILTFMTIDNEIVR